MINTMKHGSFHCQIHHVEYKPCQKKRWFCRPFDPVLRVLVHLSAHECLAALRVLLSSYRAASRPMNRNSTHIRLLRIPPTPYTLMSCFKRESWSPKDDSLCCLLVPPFRVSKTAWVPCLRRTQTVLSPESVEVALFFRRSQPLGTDWLHWASLWEIEH